MFMVEMMSPNTDGASGFPKTHIFDHHFNLFFAVIEHKFQSLNDFP